MCSTGRLRMSQAVLHTLSENPVRRDLCSGHIRNKYGGLDRAIFVLPSLDIDSYNANSSVLDFLASVLKPGSKIDVVVEGDIKADALQELERKGSVTVHDGIAPYLDELAAEATGIRRSAWSRMTALSILAIP